jgi:hypothetical protein
MKQLAGWKGMVVLSGWLLVSLFLTSSCSEECLSDIRPGARFKATLLGEQPESPACHFVDPSDLQSYEITASAAKEYAQGRTYVSATGPPPVTSIELSDCHEGSSGLGSYCSFEYTAGCEGSIAFWYGQLNDEPRDWSAGGQFILWVADSPKIGCRPPGVHGCTDTYLVRLDPIP